MKLWQYIQGNRKGKDAHQIEKEAMKDPFLADALEGYEKIPGSHQKEVAKLQKEVTRLQKRITNRSLNKQSNHLKVWGIAASILIAVGLGTWFFLDNPMPSKDLYSVNRLETEVSAIAPVPQPEEEQSFSEFAPEKTPAVTEIPSQTPVKKEIKEVEIQTIPEQIEEIALIEEDSAPVLQDSPIEMQKTVMDVAMRTASKATTDSTETQNITIPEARQAQTTTPTSDPTQPNPVVGIQGYMEYIQRNLKRPTDEECRNVKGSVVVTFKIGQSGRPYNIKVTQGLCPSINQEAIRLIINGPDWKKGSSSDEASITINF